MFARAVDVHRMRPGRDVLVLVADEPVAPAAGAALTGRFAFVADERVKSLDSHGANSPGDQSFSLERLLYQSHRAQSMYRKVAADAASPTRQARTSGLVQQTVPLVLAWRVGLAVESPFCNRLSNLKGQNHEGPSCQERPLVASVGPRYSAFAAMDNFSGSTQCFRSA